LSMTAPSGLADPSVTVTRARSGGVKGMYCASAVSACHSWVTCGKWPRYHRRMAPDPVSAPSLADEQRDIRMAHYKNEHALVDNDVDKIMKDAGVQGVDQAARIFYSTTNRVTGKYDMGYNLANHLDFEHLGGRMYDTYWDPEGLLSTLPAIVTGLLGIFAGLLLKNTKVPDMKKVAYLLAFGACGVVLGLAWGTEFPIIKKIWTSSYVLVAGGFSAMLLGIFFWIVDVMKFQFWCRPFVWMGMNSITIYMTSNIIGGFRKLGTRLAGGDVKNFFDHSVAQGFGDLVIAIAGLALAFWFVNFLYRKKIFIRL